MTGEALTCIDRADEMLYLVADPVAMSWLERRRPDARPLHASYAPGAPRADAYAAMVDEIMERVRSGARVCVAFYGHPGIFVNPSHAAIRRARSEGFEAQMLPAVSAEDCLFADLGVDPSAVGCQSYEATDLLLRRRHVDPSTGLVLWQIGVVGNLTYAPEGDTSKLPVLVDYLLRFYPAEHLATVYEASLYVVCGPSIEQVALSDLAGANVSPMSTLYVPPAARARTDPEMRERLGLQADAVAETRLART